MKQVALQCIFDLVLNFGIESFEGRLLVNSLHLGSSKNIQ